ncbi:MAG: LysM peptidoglycan-binding domain-containing protein [Actinomycetota bacterium]|nr:LysM peptidoglycan-binding domain-containing protein [Actinomycetota bacterium]
MPIALVAVIVGTYLVVEHGLSSKKSTAHAPAVAHLTHSQRKYVKKRFYFVRPGDSLTQVATRTGVAVGSIEALNPNVDPNSLQPGQRLRLRR